jgi:lipopolysaccharide transport system ATP-binding protein
MPTAIVADGLFKRYEIGAIPRETMLRERLANLLRRPWPHRQHEYIWALRDVSFSVDEGETIGIIGRNGAGKSTLLKVLSKITYPTSGRVTTRGRISSLLEVGTGFHDELTGRENVYLNGSILGMKKRDVDAKFDAIVSYAGVESFIETPVKHYSSGMRLRLGFAVAAHLDPAILVIDEVLAVGDAGFQNKCLATMKAQRSEGRTALFVSHNLAAVENLCARSIWLDEARVRMDGPTAQVIRAYMATFDVDRPVTSDFRSVRSRGSGEVRFTAVELLSTDRRHQPVTRTGDALVLRLHVEASTTIPHPSVGFRLHTDLDLLVTSASTWQNGVEVPAVPAGPGYIDVELPCVNLVPGRYTLSLWVSDGPYTSHVYDAIDHCAVIDIHTGTHEWGGNIDGRYGVVYLPRTWDLRGLGRRERLASHGAEAVLP